MKCAAIVVLLATPVLGQVSNEPVRSLALADFDSDGDLDAFIGADWPYQRLYHNNGRGVFTQARVHPPACDGTMKALAVADFDGDDDLDVYAAIGGVGSRDRLLLNDGRGVFVDATVAHLPEFYDDSESVAFGDIDRDGDFDVLVGTRYRELNRLLLNDGRGRFVDATDRLPRERDMERREDTRVVAFGDVDGDGDLDAFVGNGSDDPDRLYRNDGHGRFFDTTAFRVPQFRKATESIAFGDVDGDGDLDAILGTDAFERTRLLVNDGEGRFDDETEDRLLEDSDRTSAIVLVDADGDTDLDLWVGYDGARLRLFQNDGDGVFTDASYRLPKRRLDVTALAIGDVDRDGDVDVMVGAYVDRSRIFLNLGSGRYMDETEQRLPSAYDLMVDRPGRIKR